MRVLLVEVITHFRKCVQASQSHIPSLCPVSLALFASLTSFSCVCLCASFSASVSIASLFLCFSCLPVLSVGLSIYLSVCLVASRYCCILPLLTSLSLRWLFSRLFPGTSSQANRLPRVAPSPATTRTGRNAHARKHGLATLFVPEKVPASNMNNPASLPPPGGQLNAQHSQVHNTHNT